MNKFILFLMFIVFGQSLTAQTYYFRYTKSIIKGVENTNVTGGQFITFDGKLCYESDKYGNNVGNGTMSFDSANSTQVLIYWGACYWSKNAYMKFNADKSLLNIETNAGKIYVYKRVAPPQGVTTCSLIREKENNIEPNRSGNRTVPQIYPNQPRYTQDSYIPQQQKQTDNVRSSNSSVIRKNKEWHDNRYGKKDCYICHGSGQCQTCNGNGTYYSNLKKTECPNCLIINGRRSGKCRTCQGDGKVFGIK